MTISYAFFQQIKMSSSISNEKRYDDQTTIANLKCDLIETIARVRF